MISSEFHRDDIFVNFTGFCGFTWNFMTLWPCKISEALFLVLSDTNRLSTGLGSTRQSPFPTTDGFYILTPIVFRNLKMLYTSFLPNSEIAHPTYPASVFHFNTLEFLVRMAPCSRHLMSLTKCYVNGIWKEIFFLSTGRVLMWKISSCVTLSLPVCDV